MAMAIVLFVLGGIVGLWGFSIYESAELVTHQMMGLMAGTIGAVLIGAGAIIESITRQRSERISIESINRGVSPSAMRQLIKTWRGPPNPSGG